jgi:hypothetical protein
MAALASTGLALGQQSAGHVPAPNDQVGQVISVQEANRPVQKCIVIKSWITKEGARAHQVTALDSGETITIVEAGPSTSVAGSTPGSRSVSTRIFHWGRNNIPPSGAPMPPDAVSVACSPCTTTAPTTVACTPCETTAPAVKTEPVKRSFLPSFLTKKTEPPAVEVKEPKLASAETTPTKPAAFTTDDPKKAPVKPAKADKPVVKKADDDKKVVTASTKADKPKDDDKKVAKDDLPKVDKTKPDPLKLPEKPVEVSKTQLPTAVPANDNMFIPERGHVQLPPPANFPKAPQPNQRLANGGAATGYNMPPNGFNSPDQYSNYFENNPSDRMINAFTPVNPAPAAGGPGILAQGGQRAMMPPAPNRQVAMSAIPAVPYNGPNQLVYAAGAHGTPQTGVMQAGAQVPAGYPSNTAVIPASWQQPVMAPQQVMNAAMHQDTQGCLQTLKDSIYPSQREIAVDNLAKLDPRMHPHVVSVVVKGCTEDPAATVRAACVRCLIKMNAQGQEVTAAIQAAKADKDPRVQHEAKQAYQTPVAGK